MLGRFPSSVIDYALKYAHTGRRTVGVMLEFYSIAIHVEIRMLRIVFYYSVKWSNVSQEQTGRATETKREMGSGSAGRGGGGR